MNLLEPLVAAVQHDHDAVVTIDGVDVTVTRSNAETGWHLDTPVTRRQAREICAEVWDRCPGLCSLKLQMGGKTKVWARPTAQIDRIDLYQGDCFDVLKALPAESVETVVTDPPYGLSQHRAQDVAQALSCWLAGKPYQHKSKGFMGRSWDSFVPGPEVWREVVRVLKPGGHLLVFAGTRTMDLMGIAIRLAGLEARDTIDLHGTLSWCYGSGFPKSTNISANIDKLKGVSKAKEQEIAEYLKARRTELGLSRAQVDREVFGGSTRYAFVEGRNDATGGGRIYLPTPAEWNKLKQVLRLDDRYDEYIKQAIPERDMRHRADGGKAVEVGRRDGDFGYQDGDRWSGEYRETCPESGQAKQWSGWGSALKPSHEPILIFRKPLEGTLANNTLQHGCGGLNIGACRVATAAWDVAEMERVNTPGSGQRKGSDPIQASRDAKGHDTAAKLLDTSAGRWPPNTLLVHAPGCRLVGSKKIKGGPKEYAHKAPGKNKNSYGDGVGQDCGDVCFSYSDQDGNETVDQYRCVEGCPVLALDRQSGITTSTRHMSYKRKGSVIGCIPADQPERDHFVVETGSASRFFPCFPGETEPAPPFRYCAKASTAERNRGVEGKMQHPTTKPVAVLTWLLKLVVPPGGTVLDPFAGSGTTGVAARQLGFKAILIEREPQYCEWARQRVEAALSLEGKPKATKPPKASDESAPPTWYQDPSGTSR